MHNWDFIYLCKSYFASVAQHQMEEEFFTEVSMEIEGIQGFRYRVNRIDPLKLLTLHLLHYQKSAQFLPYLFQCVVCNLCVNWNTQA